MNVRFVLSSGKTQRAKPRAGDEKIVKGVVMVRQQQNHSGRWVVSNGRPVWEWVVKGSAADRRSKKVLPAT